MAVVEIMNYKSQILLCEVEEKGVITVTNVLEITNRDLLPLCLKNDCSVANVNKWLNSRLIPKTLRIRQKKVNEMFGSIPRYKHMFSLTDQYWLRYSRNDTWEKMNFFTNTFQTDYGRMYFNPSSVNESNLKSESPDATTNGVLMKRWIPGDQGKAYLIKMGNREAHQDPISEVLSTMTLERINIIPFVKYSLVVDGLHYCCKCENFVSEKEEFVPASQLYHLEKRGEDDDRYTHLVKMIKKYAPDIKKVDEYLDRLMVADYCICNNDRHLNNFGFIRNAETGKILRFAPIFDNGSAFFGNANKGGKTSKLFKDEQIDAACNRIFAKKNRNDAMKMKEGDLVELVDIYPVLTSAEKELIIKKVESTYKEIRERILKSGEEHTGGVLDIPWDER